MENAVSASTAGRAGRIVIAGAGYAGLHVALRLTARLRNNPVVALGLTGPQFICLALLAALGLYYGRRWSSMRAVASA